MEDYKVVGVGLRDLWDYDFIRPWMDRDKQKESVKEAIKTIPNTNYELTRKIQHLWCDPDNILAATKISGNKYRPALRIRYDKNTLSYLLNKSSEVIEKLTEAVVSGIQKGLEETLHKQEEYKKGIDHHDRGFVYLTEMEKGVAEALNKEISSEFTSKERNHMVYHFINMFVYKMEDQGDNVGVLRGKACTTP